MCPCELHCKFPLTEFSVPTSKIKDYTLGIKNHSTD